MNLLATFAKALLQAAEQLLFLAFRKFQIIIRKLGVLLLKLSFDFVPVAFDLESSHPLDLQRETFVDAAFELLNETDFSASDANDRTQSMRNVLSSSSTGSPRAFGWNSSRFMVRIFELGPQSGEKFLDVEGVPIVVLDLDAIRDCMRITDDQAQDLDLVLIEFDRDSACDDNFHGLAGSGRSGSTCGTDT